MLGHEERTAPDSEKRQWVGRRLHPVHPLFDDGTPSPIKPVEDVRNKVRHACCFTDRGQAGRNGNVRRRQRLPAEHPAFPSEAMTNASRSNGAGLDIDAGATTESDRQEVRHAEKCPDSANFNGPVGLSRKPRLQVADISCGAAHIDDHRVLESGQECGSAHAVGRPG